MDDENGNGYVDEMPIEQDNIYSNVKSQIDKHRSNSSLSKSLSKSGVSKFVPLYKLTSEQNQNPNPNPNIPQPSQSAMLPQTKTVSTNPLSKSEIKTQFSIKSKRFKPPKLDRDIWKTPQQTTQTDKPAQTTPVTSKSAFNVLSTSFIPGKSQTVKPVVATPPVTSKSAFNVLSTSFNPDYKPFKPSNSHTAASTPDTATQTDKTGTATDSKKN